jgi:type I site-specific restriction endonuclease
LPLPFAYESTGEVTQFTNTLEADARSRAVFTFHRPEELIRLAKLDRQGRSLLRLMNAAADQQTSAQSRSSRMHSAMALTSCSSRHAFAQCSHSSAHSTHA